MKKYVKQNFKKQKGRCLWCGHQMVKQWELTNPFEIQKLEGLPKSAYKNKVTDKKTKRFEHLYTSVEHIQPTSYGGKNEPKNYAVAHVGCNVKRNSNALKPHPEVLKVYNHTKQEHIIKQAHLDKKRTFERAVCSRQIKKVFSLPLSMKMNNAIIEKAIDDNSLPVLLKSYIKNRYNKLLTKVSGSVIITKLFN